MKATTNPGDEESSEVLINERAAPKLPALDEDRVRRETASTIWLVVRPDPKLKTVEGRSAYDTRAIDGTTERERK